MTFTIQEVPDWDISVEDLQMYDITLSDILADQEQCINNSLILTDEIKVEEDGFSLTQYQPPTSMIASPSMNMPVLCESYNPYLPRPQAVPSMASPSNAYAHSPADSSTYSASPIESPQQQMPPEEFMRYVNRQPYASNQLVPQSNEYSGYYYNECMSKRRRRDDELTAEEYEKRRLRRERNKQAALRCRNRRRERIEALEQETSEIEEKNEEVQNEISSLRNQIDELKEILKNHSCEKDIKPSSRQSNAVDVELKYEPE